MEPLWHVACANASRVLPCGSAKPTEVFKRPSPEGIVRGSDIPTMAMGRLLMSSWKMKAAQRRPDSDVGFQVRAVSST